MLLPLSLLATILGLLLLETGLLRRWRNCIPLRVHVNGTRGKSSVVRFIAAGLRAGGRRPFAKITGVRPTLILPAGEESLLRRRGPARVQEQLSMVRRAASTGADALVLECMSILPEYQQLERHILRPHVYVLTNIRNDHREEMGRTIEEQAEAMCDAIPENGVVVTAEEDHLALIRRYTNQRRSRLIPVRGEDVQDLSLPEGTLPINVALALAVCEACGIQRKVALEGIHDEVLRQGRQEYRLTVNGRALRFVNGFAVNDAPSASGFIRHWRGVTKVDGLVVIVLNTRADRPLRTKDLSAWIGSEPKISQVILTGTHIPYAQRQLERAGMRRERIHRFAAKDVARPIDAFARVVRNEELVVGLGNIAGDGFALLDSLEEGSRHGH